MESDMFKKVCLILLCMGSLGFFAATIFLWQERTSLQAEIQEIQQSRDGALAENVSLQEQIKLLEARVNATQAETKPETEREIANLEQLLNSRDEEISQLRQQIARQPEGRPQPPPQRNNRRNQQESHQEYMERLKAERPERYDAIQAHIQERKKALDEEAETREIFFKNLNVSKLSAEQRRTVSEYQDMLVGIEESSRRALDGEREEFSVTMERYRKMGEMSTAVRKILLENLGNSSGINGEVLSSDVEEILDITIPGMRQARRMNRR